MSSKRIVVLCPGQGAQTVGMGHSWRQGSPAAARVFNEADAIVSALPSWSGMRSLSAFCVEGPASELDRTDVSQPALYTCGIACWHAMREDGLSEPLAAAAGLSLGEYTALAIAGAITFEDGLRLVAERGRLMQAAAERSNGGMVALIGADEAQASEVCAKAAEGEVLVSANFNAPGQVVLSGHATACDRAEKAASDMGLRASRLKVAGAFHSPLMAPAAEGLARALKDIEVRRPSCDVWSNVTGHRHDLDSPSSIKELLVSQLVSPVRWSQGCTDLVAAMAADGGAAFHELAPGSVLKGLMRRIDRSTEVITHDQHDQHDQHSQAKRTERATA